jgi:hypothetical protein
MCGVKHKESFSLMGTCVLYRRDPYSYLPLYVTLNLDVIPLHNITICYEHHLRVVSYFIASNERSRRDAVVSDGFF